MPYNEESSLLVWNSSPAVTTRTCMPACTCIGVSTETYESLFNQASATKACTGGTCNRGAGRCLVGIMKKSKLTEEIPHDWRGANHQSTLSGNSLESRGIIDRSS